LSSGLSLGFSAIAIPQLKSNATWYGQTELYQPFNLNMESGSWIASIFGLGAIFGGFAAGYLGTTFGQRKTMIMLAVPDIVAWIFIASAQNVPMMLLGRFLAGFSAAGYSPTIQVGTFYYYTQATFHHILSRDHLSSFSSTSIQTYNCMTVHQPPTFLSANDTTSLKFQLVCCTAMG
jgi:MFS family permease